MLTKYELKMPHAVYSGEDALGRIPEIFAANHVRRLVVFTDKGIEGAGLLDLPMAQVKKTGVETVILDDLPAEPSYLEAQKLVDQCKECGADFIMAVGGGSVMDTAKLASILITDEYGIKELLDIPGRAKKCMKTLMIPTTAGTGSEATPNAIVAVPEKQLKVGIVNTGKALGTGIVFSFLGTIFGLVALVLISPYLAAVAIKFGPFEYCALSIFSLSLVVALTGKDMAKGLCAALLGVIAATFGISKFDSVIRFDFGSVNMQNGFQQIVVLIGLYAIPEVVTIAQEVVRPKVVVEANAKLDKIRGFGFSVKEFVAQIPNFFIAALLGTGIGILPGIGGGTAGIMSYTTIKNKSKYPEKFGTGIMDGIVASETANNAAIDGAMIPLLTLGIPGDGITAILLGSLIIHNVAPGPLIFDKNGSLMYAIYVVIGLSSLFMLIFEFVGLRGLIKALNAPKNYLMPIILAMCCVGAFGSLNRVFDIWTLLIFGLVAVLIKALNMPTMPVAIGFILGPIFEQNVRRAETFMTANPLEPFSHPIAMAILALTVLTVIASLRSNKRAREREEAAAAAEAGAANS